MLTLWYCKLNHCRCQGIQRDPLVYSHNTPAKENCNHVENLPFLPLGALTFVTFPSFSFSSFLHQNLPSGRNQVPGEGDRTMESPGFVLSMHFNIPSHRWVWDTRNSNPSWCGSVVLAGITPWSVWCEEHDSNRTVKDKRWMTWDDLTKEGLDTWSGVLGKAGKVQDQWSMVPH